MSEYHDSQLTAFGADLAQRASNGDTKFTITKATSTADDLSQTDLSQLITLPHEKQTGEVDRILPDPNGGTKVKGTKVSFDNLNLTESYPIQAMGLYAKEDVDGAKEQLYAITTAADPETMPKSDSAVMFTFSASIYVIVGNTKQVTINVNPDSFATKEYVTDAIANVKVDTSDLAKLSQDNYYTGDNQFKYDPVNKDGNAYGLAKDIATKVTDNGDGSIIVNGKTYTPADDSNTVHKSGDEEIAGTKTFDTAPIDKTTGNPYITKDGVPAVPDTLADTTKDTNFTGKLQKSGQDVAIDSQVVHRNPDTGAVSDSVNFTGTAQKGGIDLATVQDLKSVENSAWYMIPSDDHNMIQDIGLLKRDSVNNYLYIMYNFANIPWVPIKSDVLVDLSNYVDKLDDSRGYAMLSSKEWLETGDTWSLPNNYRCMSTIYAKDATLIVGSGFNANLPSNGNYLNLTTFGDSNTDDTPYVDKCIRVHYNNWIGG